MTDNTQPVNSVPATNTPYAPAPDPLKKPLGIKHIVAIISGKGGVGKSTVSANLAAALVSLGFKAGVFDADIPGHSQSMLFSSAVSTAQTKLTGEPVESFGVKVASFGFLYPDSRPIIWRGPMISNGLKSLFTQTKWGELDYLIMDLPPGTSDAQLTIIRDIPIDGGVVVTTPDTLATTVAERGLQMLIDLGKPVLGIVENMSHVHCPDCGTHIEVFGSGAGAELAKKYSIPFLGRVPVDRNMQLATATRTPIVFASPESQSAKAFVAIAQNLVKLLPL